MQKIPHEQEGNNAGAKEQLRKATNVDTGYSEALFNLAQLELVDEAWEPAKVLLSVS